MNDVQIKEIADRLIESANENEAHFSIREHSEHYGNYFFQANKDGLKLFAAELLYASQINTGTNTWGINAKWFDANQLDLSYINVIDAKPFEQGTDKKPASKFNEIIKTTGCLFIMALLALFVLVGAGTIFRKIFEWF